MNYFFSFHISLKQSPLAAYSIVGLLNMYAKCQHDKGNVSGSIEWEETQDVAISADAQGLLLYSPF